MIKRLNAPRTYHAIIDTGVYNTAYVTNFQKCVLFTPVYNDSNCFDTTNGVYTVKESGRYSISLWVNYSNVTSRCGFGLFINGAQTMEMFDIPNPQYCNVSSEVFKCLTAGDTILIARMSNLGNTPDGSTISMSTGNLFCEAYK